MAVTVILHTSSPNIQTIHLSISAPTCKTDLEEMTALFERELEDSQCAKSTEKSTNNMRHLFVADCEIPKNECIPTIEVYAIRGDHGTVYSLLDVRNLANHMYPHVFNDGLRRIQEGFTPLLVASTKNDRQGEKGKFAAKRFDNLFVSTLYKLSI